MLATRSFAHPNYAKRREQITKLLITELSPSTSQVLPFTSKYFPPHPVLTFAQRYPSVTNVYLHSVTTETTINVNHQTWIFNFGNRLPALCTFNSQLTTLNKPYFI